MKGTSPFIERKTNRLQTVPWFNKNEWSETYNEIYSKDEKLQEKAYTQMCIWKTRYPNLPLGVECTMNMLHVKLCDKQTVGTTTYKDRDLQLLYSTAVMRFLNQLAVMSNCKDSMYKMAEQHKIPDWLINLRHEAAHGNSVPALYLLRQASDIILQWLQQHYWETEANVMADVIKDLAHDKESCCEKINELLNMWIELKIHYWAGSKTIDRIPNERLRAKAMELASEEGCGSKNPSLKDTKYPFLINEKMDSLTDKTIIDESSTELYTHKIKTAFEPLLRRLFYPLGGKKFKTTLYQECLIDCLLENKSFCPVVNLSQIDESDALQMMSLLGELWKELLNGLQSHRLLHHLMRALVKRDEQMPSVHLWLRLLSQLLSGDPLPSPPGTEAGCQLLAENLPCDVDTKLHRKELLNGLQSHRLLHHLMRALVKRDEQMPSVHPVSATITLCVLLHLQYQSPCLLKSPSAQETDVLQQLAHKVLENPTHFSSKYLKSLLCFWETPLNAHTVEKLCILASLYSGKHVEQSRPDNVHTVASLLDQGLIINQTEDDCMSDIMTPSTSPWELYIGNADWSKCALGVLPWENSVD